MKQEFKYEDEWVAIWLQISYLTALTLILKSNGGMPWRSAGHGIKEVVRLQADGLSCYHSVFVNGWVAIGNFMIMMQDR